MALLTEKIIKQDCNIIPLLNETSSTKSDSELSNLVSTEEDLDAVSSVKPVPLFKYTPAFNSELFNTSQFQLPDVDFCGCKRFDILCDIGLEHWDSSILSFTEFSRPQKNDCYDLSNTGWSFPKLPNTDTGNGKNNKNTRFGMHQDEGYVTPDQDQIYKWNSLPYCSWENLHENKLKYAYSWESYGGATEYNNCPYIFHKRFSSSQIWNAVYAHDATSYLHNLSIPVTVKCITLEEFGIALKNLLTGIESNIFQYSFIKNTFVTQDGLCIFGSTHNILLNYCEPFIQCANYYRNISHMLINTNEQTNGISSVFQALRNNVQCYLQCYSGIIQELLSVQHFLQTYHWVYTLQNQLYFLYSIFQTGSTVRGGSLLALLYDEVPLINKIEVSFILYYILQSCCNVYFSLLKKWIFEGECIDMHKEFFIEALDISESFFNRKFWSRAFVLNKMLVPGFLKGFETDILLCGKSMALLKLCSQDDPLCLGMKQGYPNLICCLNKTQLEELQEECLYYKERIKSLYHHKHEALEPAKDYDYYKSIRAQSLSRIKKTQEEQKKLIDEQKQNLFRELKENAEISKSHKHKIEIQRLEEETNILIKEKELNDMNDLRRFEERQNLVDLYSAKSELANRRIQRAEWKIRRAELHGKRIEFLKRPPQPLEINKDEDIEYNKAICGKSALPSVKDRDYSSATLIDLSNVPADKKYDYTRKIEIVSNSKSQIEKCEEARSLEVIREHDVNEPTEDTKIQWLKALDEASEARHSASMFKEKCIYSNYNILTGEVVSFKEKFNTNQNKLLLPSNESTLNSRTMENDINMPPDKDKSTMTTNEPHLSSKTIENITTCQSDKDETNIHLNFSNNAEHGIGNNNEPTSLTIPLHSHLENTSVLENSSIKDKSSLSKCLEAILLKHNLSLKEIDMTTIYQNLQSSIKIPLTTQLELTNEAVMRLFFNKHNLLQHLKCLKQYFFLFDGNFCKLLTTSLFLKVQTLQQPSQLLNVTTLNSLLRLSIGSKSNEECTERLSFFINEIPAVFRLLDPEALNCISMQYKTHWPLNVIITDTFILNCDKVFRFLIQLQRVSWVLDQEVYLLKTRKCIDDQQLRQIQLFRYVMSHFVSSLKMYVYSVALEESWKKFKKNIEKVKTLNDIYAASVGYIKTVLSRCLLSRKSTLLQKELINVFGIILKFHEALRCGDWKEDIENSGIYRYSNIHNLKKIFKEFLKESKLLYKKIQDTASCGHQHHLNQLHILLSGNDFYVDHSSDTPS